MEIGVTLIGQMITFLLFVLFTKKYVFPNLQRALSERQLKIADGLAAGARGHHNLVLAQEAAKKQMKEAKEAALHIVEDAKKQAVTLVETAKIQAQEEAKRLAEKAQLDIDQMLVQAKETLRKQVSTLAILGAEKILSGHIDQAANQTLLDQLADEL